MTEIMDSREVDNSEKTVLRNWCIVPGENIKKESFSAL